MPTNTSICAQTLSAVKHVVYTKEIAGDVGGVSPLYELLVVKGESRKTIGCQPEGGACGQARFLSLRFFMFSTWFSVGFLYSISHNHNCEFQDLHLLYLLRVLLVLSVLTVANSNKSQY